MYKLEHQTVFSEFDKLMVFIISQPNPYVQINDRNTNRNTKESYIKHKNKRNYMISTKQKQDNINVGVFLLLHSHSTTINSHSTTINSHFTPCSMVEEKVSSEIFLKILQNYCWILGLYPPQPPLLIIDFSRPYHSLKKIDSN